jgi:hypothetical protein
MALRSPVVRRSVAVAPLYVRTRRKRKDWHFLGGLLLTHLCHRPPVFDATHTMIARERTEGGNEPSI